MKWYFLKTCHAARGTPPSSCFLQPMKSYEMDAHAQKALLAVIRSGAVHDATLAIEAAASAPAGFRGPPPPPAESDAHRVLTRQRQVAMGKNTLGYEVYRLRLPLI